jgi:hypothetical protein
MFNQLEKKMTENTVFLPRQPSWWRLGRYATGLAFAAILAACGGGSDSTTDTGGGGGTPTTCTTSFVDSFGNQVTCATMKTLPGAEFAGGDSGSGDAGADGTGADGAAIANATIRITDVNGKVVTTTTNASGYFRVNIGGLKQPLVASVQRSGNAWRSGMVEVIQPGRSKFYTLNLTGLTDLVMSELATASGVTGGSDAVTPSVLATNSSKLSQAVQTVKSRVSTNLQQAGVNVSTFDPLTTPFRADSTGYDKVLDSVTIVKSGDSTLIDTTGNYALSGNWEMKVVAEGQEYVVGTFPGSAVPPSSALVGVDFTAALGQGSESVTYTVDGKTYTVTVSGATSTITGPQTNFSTTVNSVSVTNYVGCGACGVGSTVSFAYAATATVSGTMDGMTIPTTTVDLSSQVVYRRLN